jgi:hypothetical protein
VSLVTGDEKVEGGKKAVITCLAPEGAKGNGELGMKAG